MLFVRSTTLLIITLVLLFGGVTPAPASAVNVTVKVLNASPDTGAIDLYDNQTLLVSNLPFRTFSRSFPLGEGLHLFRVFPAGANIATTLPIMQFNVSLPPSYSYVIGIADRRATLLPMAITDPAVPRAGYFRYRVVNLSPGMPSVDLVNSSGLTIIDDVTFGGAKFATLPSGRRRYHFQVRQHGTANILIDLPNTSFGSRSRQTLWLFNANAGLRSFGARELKNEQFILSQD